MCLPRSRYGFPDVIAEIAGVSEEQKLLAARMVRISQHFKGLGLGLDLLPIHSLATIFDVAKSSQNGTGRRLCGDQCAA